MTKDFFIEKEEIMAENHRTTNHQIMQDNQNHKQLTVGIINSFPKFSSLIVFITANNPSKPNNPGSSAGNNPMDQLASIMQGSCSYYHCFFLKLIKNYY